MKVASIKQKEYLEKMKSNNAISNVTNDDDDDNTVFYKSPQVTIDQLNRFYFQGKFSDKVVKDQIEIILGAGFDSSSLTLSFALLLLAMYPDVQEKLFDELHSCNDDQNDTKTNEQIQQLLYLDCVVKESMRLFPVGSFLGTTISRESPKTYTILFYKLIFPARTCTADIPMKTFTIPKGSFISISIFNLHRVTSAKKMIEKC